MSVYTDLLWNCQLLNLCLLGNISQFYLGFAGGISEYLTNDLIAYPKLTTPTIGGANAEATLSILPLGAFGLFLIFKVIKYCLRQRGDAFFGAFGGLAFGHGDD